MKKLVSLILSVVMVASMVPFAVTANAAESDVKPVSVEPVIEETPTEQPTTAPETTQPVTAAPVKAPAAPQNFKVKETASDYIIIRWDRPLTRQAILSTEPMKTQAVRWAAILL